MKKAIFTELKNNFKKKFKREPDAFEIKSLGYLTYVYSRDMKSILKMEMDEFTLKTKEEKIAIEKKVKEKKKNQNKNKQEN